MSKVFSIRIGRSASVSILVFVAALCLGRQQHRSHKKDGCA